MEDDGSCLELMEALSIVEESDQDDSESRYEPDTPSVFECQTSTKVWMRRHLERRKKSLDPLSYEANSRKKVSRKYRRRSDSDQRIALKRVSTCYCCGYFAPHPRLLKFHLLQCSERMALIRKLSECSLGPFST